jgi:hypothetical protein
MTNEMTTFLQDAIKCKFPHNYSKCRRTFVDTDAERRPFRKFNMNVLIAYYISSKLVPQITILLVFNSYLSSKHYIFVEYDFRVQLHL